MRTIPAWRKEFGLKVRYHVPWVHALPGPKRVEIEEGEEALYPSADEWVIVPRAPDEDRKGRAGLPGPDEPVKRFVPKPYKPQGVSADVVICPRFRQYGSAKNWPNWSWLAEQLTARGINTFAAGAPDSSADVACPAAWDYERFLDASIEAMRSARLVISTDAGLAHLAVLCGAPLLLITHSGRVAPGPVLDKHGRVMEPEYWTVRLSEYYHAANHTGSPIWMSYDWIYRKLLRDEVLTMLEWECARPEERGAA